MCAEIFAHWLLILMVTISVVAIAITPVFGTNFSTLLFLALLGGICVRGFSQGLNLPLMMIILARNVAPHFQGSMEPLYSSNKFTRENRLEVVGRNVEAVRSSLTDTGRDVPDAYRERTLGILDVESNTKKGSKTKKAKKKTG